MNIHSINEAVIEHLEGQGITPYNLYYQTILEASIKEAIEHSDIAPELIRQIVNENIDAITGL